MSKRLLPHIRFPYNNPVEFAALAAVLEGGGVSAYSGALAAFTNKKLLTVAGEILPMEARHNAFSTLGFLCMILVAVINRMVSVNSAVNHEQPFSSPVDTPLTPK